MAKSSSRNLWSGEANRRADIGSEADCDGTSGLQDNGARLPEEVHALETLQTTPPAQTDEVVETQTARLRQRAAELDNQGLEASPVHGQVSF